MLKIFLEIILDLKITDPASWTLFNSDQVIYLHSGPKKYSDIYA